MICDCGGAVEAGTSKTSLGREDYSVAVNTDNTVQTRLEPYQAGAAWCAVRPVRRAHTMQPSGSVLPLQQIVSAHRKDERLSGVGLIQRAAEQVGDSLQAVVQRAPLDEK